MHFENTVATIRLRRPQEHNRLQDEDIACIRKHIVAINDNPQIRVVIFDAQYNETNPVFCAGYNIFDFDAHNIHPTSANTDTPLCRFEQLVDDIENLRPFTICKLAGSVYGGATDWLLACDYVVGIPGIVLKMPAAELGIHYYPSGMRRYISRVGISTTKKAFFTAHVFSAQEMLEHHFIHDLVPAQQLHAHVTDIVERVQRLSAMSIQSMKPSFNRIAAFAFDATQLKQRQPHFQGQWSGTLPAHDAAANHSAMATQPHIVAIDHSQRHLLCQHLQSLSRDARYARFGYTLHDEAIAHYVQTLDFQKVRIFALTDGAQQVYTVAELHLYQDGPAELVVSVLRPTLPDNADTRVQQLVRRTLQETPLHQVHSFFDDQRICLHKTLQANGRYEWTPLPF